MTGPGSYRLQAVLDLREAAVESAEKELARADEALGQARMDCDRAEARASQAAREVADRQAQARALAAAPRFTGERWQAEQRFLGRLVRARTRLEQVAQEAARRLARAEQAAAAARQALVEARREAEVLRRHREQAERERRRQQDRRAEQEQDDLSLARYRDPDRPD